MAADRESRETMRVVLCACAAVVVAACLVLPSSRADGARTTAQNMSRNQIRSMPVLERPNRPMHIYGNAVRRRYYRGVAR